MAHGRVEAGLPVGGPAEEQRIGHREEAEDQTRPAPRTTPEHGDALHRGQVGDADGGVDREVGAARGGQGQPTDQQDRDGRSAEDGDEPHPLIERHEFNGGGRCQLHHRRIGPRPRVFERGRTKRGAIPTVPNVGGTELDERPIPRSNSRALLNGGFQGAFGPRRCEEWARTRSCGAPCGPLDHGPSRDTTPSGDRRPPRHAAPRVGARACRRGRGLPPADVQEPDVPDPRLVLDEQSRQES